MKKINKVNLSRFKNNEHAQFHTAVQAEIMTETPEKLGVNKFLQSYIDNLVAEQAAIEVEQGSQHSKTIEVSDLFRDQLYRAFGLQIKSGVLSYDANIQAAANRVQRIIAQVGDMRKDAYNDESKKLTSLTNQLENNYAADLELCGVTVLFQKLKEANNSFINDFGTRTTEVSSRVSGDVRATRPMVDEQFKNICSVVNALVLLNDEATYATFIDKVNYLIDYYTNTINNRQSSSKKENPKKD